MDQDTGEAVVDAVEPIVDDAAAVETQEWDDAANELFPGLKAGKKEDKEENEPVEPGEKSKTPKTPEDDAKKDEAKPGKTDKGAATDDADAEEVEAEDEQPDTSARDARVSAREAAQQVEAVKTDVRAKMFANVPQVLQDADGDPIRGIEDVMRLINPRTKEPFTEEEAGMWFLSAQQQFNQNIANIEKQIDQIAEVNVALKDEADNITFNFGELLKAMPELRDEIWADYQETLVKDPESGIITKAPISLQRFYERQLKPYADMARRLEAEEDTGEEGPKDDKPKVDPDKAKEDAKKERDKKRADRSDIFGAGKDPEDPEDKEWDEAATAVFGPRKTK